MLAPVKERRNQLDCRNQHRQDRYGTDQQALDQIGQSERQVSLQKRSAGLEESPGFIALLIVKLAFVRELSDPMQGATAAVNFAGNIKQQEGDSRMDIIAGNQIGRGRQLVNILGRIVVDQIAGALGQNNLG